MPKASRFKTPSFRSVFFCVAAMLAISLGAGWPWDPLTAQRPSAAAALQTALILRCHDGDTCTARMGEGKERRLRLIAIDAPELGKGKGAADQAHAEESRDALVKEVVGREAQVRIWNTDRYGRSLAEIFLNGRNMNVWMVQSGHAEVYRGLIDIPPPLQPYFSAELEARRHKLGIWGLEKYESPRRFRRGLSKN